MLDGLIDMLKDAIIWAFDWAKEIALALLIPILQAVGNLIPSNWKAAFTGFIQWMGYTDCWLNISFGIKLWLAYYAIKAALFVVQKILKAIPGIW